MGNAFWGYVALCSLLAQEEGCKLEITALDTLNPTSMRGSQQTTHFSRGVVTCNIPEGSKKHPVP